MGKSLGRSLQRAAAGTVAIFCLAPPARARNPVECGAFMRSSQLASAPATDFDRLSAARARLEGLRRSWASGSIELRIPAYAARPLLNERAVKDLEPGQIVLVDPRGSPEVRR